MSAVDVAGEPRRGREKGLVRHHGSQPGRVTLSGKRIQLDRPRLRSKDGREVALSAHEELSRDPKQADRVLARVLKGISTREYQGVFDEAGEELRLSKSNVSRKVAQAGKKQVLGLSEGATESAASVGALLDSMVERGVDPSLSILFVLDGGKALAKAVRNRSERGDSALPNPQARERAGSSSRAQTSPLCRPAYVRLETAMGAGSGQTRRDLRRT